MEQEQPLLPQGVADGGTRLGVGARVRKFIGAAERLARVPRADPAGQIHFFPDNVIPKPVDGLDVIGISAERCHVGHSGIHVHGPDGMADRFFLLDDRLMVLHVFIRVVNGERVLRVVFFTAEIMAALIKEESGQVKIRAISRHPVQLGQADLDLLVARESTSFARAECPDKQVGVLDSDVQESPLSGRQVVSDGGFIHVAHVVQLMAYAQVGPALFAGSRGEIFGIVSPRRVEVAIGLLGHADDDDKIIELVLELRIGMQHQRVRYAFHDLEDV